jgi:hypothetical protein
MRSMERLPVPFPEESQLYHLEIYDNGSPRITIQNPPPSVSAYLEAKTALPGETRIEVQSTRVGDYLFKDLATPELNKLAGYLWSIAKHKTNDILSLVEHKAQGRKIVVTESLELHLVKTFDQIFIKPIPEYLLSFAFWKFYLVGEVSPLPEPDRRDIVKTVRGYLRSYSYLIRHGSDFFLATDGESPLLPGGFGYSAFMDFISWFQPVPDTDVSPRYAYGDLELTRLNLLSMAFLGSKFQRRCEEQKASDLINISVPPFPSDDQLYRKLALVSGPPRIERTDSYPTGAKKEILPGFPRIKLHGPGMDKHLQQHLTTPKLDKLAPRLWLVGEKARLISSLSDLKRNRRIFITENPELHLVETSGKLLVKPLPKYLLSYSFWEFYICSEFSPLTESLRRDVARAARGLLRSYLYLIRQRLDFSIATRRSMSLLPNNIDYSTFITFVTNFERITDGDVSPRYAFGVLRLTRLNFLSKIVLTPTIFSTDMSYFGFFKRIALARQYNRLAARINHDEGEAEYLNWPPIGPQFELQHDFATDFPEIRRISASPQLGSYLLKELATPKLDKHAWALGLLAKNFSFQTSSLGDQIVQGHQIIITENPELHLAETHDCVFIKPIPRYLLSHTFWQRHICNPNSQIRNDVQLKIAKAARGFLRSYLYLIPCKSDFILSKKRRLLPMDITYDEFVDLVNEIGRIDDKQVSLRHIYGELWVTGFWSMLFSYKSGRQRAYLSRLHNLAHNPLRTPPALNRSEVDEHEEFSLPLEDDPRRGDYWSQIQKLDASEFSLFSMKIRNQTLHEREEGRAAIIEFLDGERREHTNFNRSREFLAYFANKGVSKTPRRRLFVIEGLPWNYIGTLGVELRIFPSIFAAHLGSNFIYSLDILSPNEEKKRQMMLEFINVINVSSLWSSKPGDLPETLAVGNTVLQRRLRLPGFNEQLGQPYQVAELDGRIAYWGRQNDDGGWDGQ